jgi:hypothetical protein
MAKKNPASVWTSAQICQMNATQPTTQPASAPASQSPVRPPTDYRAIRRRTDRNLAIAVVLFLVGVGGVLITLIYGAGPAALGAACLATGSGLFGLVWLILTLMERWAGP